MLTLVRSRFASTDGRSHPLNLAPAATGHACPSALPDDDEAAGRLLPATKFRRQLRRHGSLSGALERQLATLGARAPRAPRWANGLAQLCVVAGGLSSGVWGAAWLRQGVRGAAALAMLNGEAPMPPRGTVAAILLPGAVATGAVYGALRAARRLQRAPLSQQSAWFALATSAILLVALRQQLDAGHLAAVLIGTAVAVVCLHGLEVRAEAGSRSAPPRHASRPVPSPLLAPVPVRPLRPAVSLSTPTPTPSPPPPSASPSPERCSADEDYTWV